MNKYLKVLLRVGISAFFIILLLKTQNLEAIKKSISTYKFIYLPIGLLLSLLRTYIASIRWRVILEAIGQKVKTKDLIILNLKGYFYNNFLPTQLGGDAYRSIALGAHIKNQPDSLFSVFMDRFGGLVVLLVMALFGIGSIYGLKGISISLGILIIGAILYSPVLNFLSKKIKFFKKFKEASDLFIKDKRAGFWVVFYSFLVQVVSFLLTYILFMGVDVFLPLQAVIAYMPWASLSLMLPSFNGIGTQEGVYILLFGYAGVTASAAITSSLMQHGIRLLMSLIGGVLIMFGIGFDDKKEADKVVEEEAKK